MRSFLVTIGVGLLMIATSGPASAQPTVTTLIEFTSDAGMKNIALGEGE